MNSQSLTHWTPPTYLSLCSFPPLTLCAPLHPWCSYVISTFFNTCPVCPHFLLFLHQMCLLWGTCVRWNLRFCKCNSNVPFLGLLPRLPHPKSALFLLSSHSPLVTHLPPECGVQHVVFMCLSHPPMSRLRQTHVKSPVLAQGLLQRRVPGNVYWLNDWNYWPCINGSFHTLRNCCPFFPPYLFSAWCSLSPCMYPYF